MFKNGVIVLLRYIRRHRISTGWWEHKRMTSSVFIDWPYLSLGQRLNTFISPTIVMLAESTMMTNMSH